MKIVKPFTFIALSKKPSYKLVEVPFNDNLRVNVLNENNVLLFTQSLDVATVGNYGSSNWISANVFLGQIPIGTSLSVKVSAVTTNVLDSALTSYGYVDGFKIVKV